MGLIEPQQLGEIRRVAAEYTVALTADMAALVDPADADDLTQEVVAVLVRELPSFHHDLRRGAFRRWLRGGVLNRLRPFWRARRARPQALGAGEEEVFAAARGGLVAPHRPSPSLNGWGLWWS